MRPYRFLLATIAILLIGSGTLLAQEESTARIIGSDDPDSLKAFIMQIGGFGPNSADTTYYIRQLPENLPFELDLPADTTITGGVKNERDGFTRVFLDSDLDPETFVDSYRELLSSETWNEINNRPSIGGFASMPLGISFCYGDAEASMDVVAYEQADGSTHASAFIVAPADAMACNESPEDYDPYRLMPALRDPEGVTRPMRGGGGGGGGGGPRGQFTFNSEATLIAENYTATELADAYHPQLEDEGWALVVQTVSETSVVSTWTFEADGSEWTGMLSLIADPQQEGAYFAMLRIQEHS